MQKIVEMLLASCYSKGLKEKVLELVTARDSEGMTALHFAVANGHFYVSGGSFYDISGGETVMIWCFLHELN